MERMKKETIHTYINLGLTTVATLEMIKMHVETLEKDNFIKSIFVDAEIIKIIVLEK